MEAVLVPYSPDQPPISPYKYNKQVKTSPKKSPRAFISKPSETHGGLLHHPSLSFSYPSSAPLFNQSYLQQQQQQQPPLLPLPNPITHQSLPSRTRGLSSPPTRKPTKPRGQSLTPKKSKPTKREDPKQDLKTTTHALSQCLIIASTKRLGPDPNDLPKDVSRVLSSAPGGGKSFGKVVDAEEFEKFSGSVFSLAPPPSSLPLPKFSLRPKLSCNVEASAGIDAGATDNLRRLLRLH